MANTKNLLILAALLDSSKIDEGNFSMHAFVMDDVGREYQPEDVNDNLVHECGTIACALGHAPLIFKPEPDEGWTAFSRRVFGISSIEDEWEWLFGGKWAGVDNTAKGAARRIRYYVHHGLPSHWRRQMNGEEPIGY